MPYPRTPREFADLGRVVLVACRCGHEQVMDPLMVAFTHGEDFDLGGGLRELAAQFSCEACGSPRPIITLGQRQETVEEEARPFIAERASRRSMGGRRLVGPVA